jgi:CBS domain-containing protein
LVLIDHILQRKGADVVTITAGEPVTRAVDTLRQHNVGALVVTSDPGAAGDVPGGAPRPPAGVVGVISERDVVRALATEGAAALDRSVGDLMSSDVTTCGPRATVNELMKVMTERRIRHIPVLDEAQRLVGIVSIGDVVKSRIGELEDETETLHDYLSGRA